jgi:hypothetical protein
MMWSLSAQATPVRHDLRCAMHRHEGTGPPECSADAGGIESVRVHRDQTGRLNNCSNAVSVVVGAVEAGP